MFCETILHIRMVCKNGRFLTVTVRVMEWILIISVGFITASAAPLANKTVLTLNTSTRTATVDSASNLSEDILVAASKYKPMAVIKNCSLVSKEAEIPDHIKEMLSSGIKLIKYNLILDHTNIVWRGNKASLVFKPLYWVRTSGRQGTGLLLLRNEFDVLSLTSLSIGVRELDVTLIETPRGCLSKFPATEAEMLLRETVLNDFENASDGTVLEMMPRERVCNMHIKDTQGSAEFRYYCCHRSPSGLMTCEYLYEDTWLAVLFFVIGFLKVVVILCSPRLVPGYYYRKKFVAAPYIHKLKDSVDSKLELNIVSTQYPVKFRNARNIFKLKKFRDMEAFKHLIQRLQFDVPYKIVLDKLHMKIKADRILPGDYAPVGLLQTLYESLVKCNIRKRDALTPCCTANVCSSSPCKRTFTWYKLMKKIMMFVLLIALATPWIIRIAVYYNFEHTEMNMRKNAANERSLRFYFPGNFTLLLTPLHVIFIFIYLLLSFESCIYGVLSKRVKEQFKFVLRKCFRDMREKKRGEVIGWAVTLALKPCTKFGGFGFCFGIVAWVIGFPFMCVILAFYLLPTLNITLRLFAHFAVYLFPRNTCSYACCKRISEFLTHVEKNLHIEAITSTEKLEKSETLLKSGFGRLQQLTVIILCLISLYSIIFLLTELVSFGVEILIHTLMGIILNASVTLTYVSLILLLALYANDCFGHVTKSFLAYNKLLNGLILGLGKGKCEDIMYGLSDNQENLAFRVSTDRSSVVKAPVQLIKDSMGCPRWRLSRLLLFLSRYDVPYIPKSFYFKACKMPFYAVPGELLPFYLRAAVEFGAILVFLLFVLVVVLAFGDTYEISTSNQLLATVAGGFVPFMLRKIVFKTHSPPTIDTSSIHFQVCFNDLLEKYTQSWPVHDFIVNQPKRIERQQSVYFDCLMDTELNDANGTVEPSEISIESSPLTGQEPRKTPAQLSDIPIDILIDTSEVDAEEFPAMTEHGHLITV